MKTIRLFKSFLGICIINKTDKEVILVNAKNKTYGIFSFEKFNDICEEYKGCNVINKPYCILCFQQYVKGSTYGLKSEKMTEVQYDEFIKEYTKVEI